jgi:L-asparaginase
VKSKKPVVLTAAMRPSTALSRDGPLNFYNAVAVAANKDAAGRGVLVVVNDWIHGGSSLTKASTTAVQDLHVAAARPDRHRELRRGRVLSGTRGPNTVDSEFSLEGVTALPRVDIVMAHANMDGKLIDARSRGGPRGS